MCDSLSLNTITQICLNTLKQNKLIKKDKLKHFLRPKFSIIAPKFKTFSEIY